LTKPLSQLKSQLDCEHVGLPCSGLGQGLSQPPQALAVCVVSRHAPEQLLSPGAQALAQLPFEHTMPAAQAWLQAPQLAGSLIVSRH